MRRRTHQRHLICTERLRRGEQLPTLQELPFLVKFLSYPVDQVLLLEYRRLSHHSPQAGIAQHIDDAATRDLVLLGQCRKVNLRGEGERLVSKIVFP